MPKTVPLRLILTFCQGKRLRALRGFSTLGLQNLLVQFLTKFQNICLNLIKPMVQGFLVRLKLFV